MAMHLDHISISTTNLYYGAHRLRLETGLSFYDGGFFAGGNANRIFPLGGQTYLEIGGVVEAAKVREVKDRPWWYSKVAVLGESFSGLCFRVDTMEELEEIAKKKNYTINQNPVTRTRPNGSQVKAFSAPGAGDTWPKGLSNWYYFTNFAMHPSGQPVFNWPDIVRPDGISFLEVGGTPKEMTEWLGVDESTFPFRYNEKAAGLYAVGVKTMKGGEIVIRRPSCTEF
jgi:hypothetical protein